MFEGTVKEDTANPETRYIPVAEQYLGNQTVTLDQIPGHSVEQQLQKHLLPILNFAREHAETPNPSLETAISYAKKQVNHLRKVSGLPQIDPKVMSVTLLNRNNFETLIKNFNSNPDFSDTGAFAAYPIESVFLRIDDYLPDYILASYAEHELLHLWLDLHVSPYASLRENSSPQIKIAANKRAGLRITGDWGTLLNELGNMVWQRNFMIGVLTSDEFSTERNERLSRLEQIGLDPNASVVIGRAPDGRKILLDMRNIHFDKAGNLLIDRIAFKMAQLVDDISGALGLVEDQSVSELLLKSKVKPQLQNKLRTAIDVRFCRGFYARLKREKYEIQSVEKLLETVQEFLYPQLIPSQPHQLSQKSFLLGK